MMLLRQFFVPLLCIRMYARSDMLDFKDDGSVEDKDHSPSKGALVVQIETTRLIYSRLKSIDSINRDALPKWSTFCTEATQIVHNADDALGGIEKKVQANAEKLTHEIKTFQKYISQFGNLLKQNKDST